MPYIVCSRYALYLFTIEDGICHMVASILALLRNTCHSGFGYIYRTPTLFEKIYIEKERKEKKAGLKLPSLLIH